MALNLSTAGIVDGQVITAAQITQSIDALTGAAAYNITISGSFAMGLNTTGSGTYNRSLRAASVEISSLGVNNYYTIPYLTSTGSSTANIVYSGTSPSYNPVTETLKATNFQGTASYATTASYAASGGTPASISGETFPNGAGPTTQTLKMIAGNATLAGGAPPFTATITSPSLIGKNLGLTVWPVATYSGSVGGGQAVQIDSLNTLTGALTFSGPLAGDFFFHVMYV